MKLHKQANLDYHFKTPHIPSKHLFTAPDEGMIGVRRALCINSNENGRLSDMWVTKAGGWVRGMSGFEAWEAGRGFVISY